MFCYLTVVIKNSKVIYTIKYISLVMGDEKTIGHFTAVEKTQEEFSSYIGELNDQANCKYMESMHGIVNLCNCHFNCKFQTIISYKLRLKAKNECKRSNHMKLKKLL